LSRMLGIWEGGSGGFETGEGGVLRGRLMVGTETVETNCGEFVWTT